MQQLYLSLDHTSDVPGAYRMPADALAAATGGNLGNLVFRHGLRHCVAGLDGWRAVTFGGLAAAAAEAPVARVAVSCANWLGQTEASDAANANRARLLEAVDAPIAAFGLGVQAASAGPAPRLGPGALRLARVLAERGPRIAVRCALTAEVLSEAGIDGAEVLGCPSHFIDPDPALGARLAARAERRAAGDPDWADLRLAVSETAKDHPQAQALAGWALGLLARSPGFYMVQAPGLMRFVIDREALLPAVYRRGYAALPALRALEEIPAGRAPEGISALRAPEELPAERAPDGASALRAPDGAPGAGSAPEGVPGAAEALLRTRALHLSSVEAWLDIARTCDLGLGMRAHGTIVALQAGVPALLVAHDRRTQGLAEAMGLPHLPPDAAQALTARRPAALLETVAAGLAGFDARRQALAGRMVAMLQAHGLPPHPALLGLAGQGAGAGAAS